MKSISLFLKAIAETSAQSSSVALRSVVQLDVPRRKKYHDLHNLYMISLQISEKFRMHHIQSTMVLAFFNDAGDADFAGS